MPNLDKLDIEVIRGLAANRLNVTDTAHALFLHRNTVLFRIRRVKKKIGIDPMDFYGMCKLLMLVGRMEKEGDNAEVSERQ